MRAMPPTLEQLRDSIVDGDDPTAESLARKALDEGLAPVDILEQAILPGIDTAGKLWQDGEYFMSHVILSTEAFKAALAVVEPLLKETDVITKGRVAIGVVAGDMHDLGVSIVMAMLQGAGFAVEFLGLNLENADFIEKVRKGDILPVWTCHICHNCSYAHATCHHQCQCNQSNRDADYHNQWAEIWTAESIQWRLAIHKDYRRH